MNTREKLAEAKDILDALLASKYAPATVVRLHHLVTSALEDFFCDKTDTACLPLWRHDPSEHDQPGFPAA
jgi:hypothetical protein